MRVVLVRCNKDSEYCKSSRSIRYETLLRYNYLTPIMLLFFKKFEKGLRNGKKTCRLEDLIVRCLVSAMYL